MKQGTYDFSPPPIVGVLGDETLTPEYARSCERALGKAGMKAACLPFRVAPRYLKNLIACMKLMDIQGLFVHPAHGRRIVPHVNSVEPAAKHAKCVDTIIRHGSRFVGMNARSRSTDDKNPERQAILAAAALIAGCQKLPTKRRK